MGLVIIFAVLARRTQKQKKFKEDVKSASVSTKPATSTPSTASKASNLKSSVYGQKSQKQQGFENRCVRCGSVLRPGDIFCSECGGKVSGRSTSAIIIPTPINSKIYSYCGAKLEPIDNFCKYCGTRVENIIQ
ncbi:MAG: zinc ribbon domain-containing protein [Promethearchaeota archaeon]